MQLTSRPLWTAMLVTAMAGAAPSAHAFEMGVHFAITDEVLSGMGFSPESIQAVKAGNEKTDQDEWTNSAAHFDSEAFAAGSARLREKLDAVIEAITSCNQHKALEELGRALHAVQDFYAHSTFVELGGETPVDLLTLEDPPPEVGCRYEVTGLTSGYFPDDRRPLPHKCTHAESHKDGPFQGELHQKARASATDATRRFVARFLSRLRREFPNRRLARSAIRFLKATDSPELRLRCERIAPELLLVGVCASY